MRDAREGLTLALSVLVGVLVVACAVGGIQVSQAHDARARDAAQHARYDGALDAATAEGTAFVNVSHETAQADLARIAAGATGPLKDRYTEDVDEIVRSLRRDKTATAGEVVWAGVVRVDDANATVLVATDGTRADRRTRDEREDRDLRLRLRLVEVDGAWLTSEIEVLD
jgi:Mce-associated membrane protein